MAPVKESEPATVVVVAAVPPVTVNVVLACSEPLEVLTTSVCTPVAVLAGTVTVTW